MSGDDHGHGHDSHDGPSDIIPLGSWQDNMLAIVALSVLAGFCAWGVGITSGIAVPVHAAHHASGHKEAVTAGHSSLPETAPAGTEAEHASSAVEPAVETEPKEGTSAATSEEPISGASDSKSVTNTESATGTGTGAGTGTGTDGAATTTETATSH